MSTIINPIRNKLLKRELLKGKSQSEAMRCAGFAISTAHSRARKTSMAYSRV